MIRTSASYIWLHKPRQHAKRSFPATSYTWFSIYFRYRCKPATECMNHVRCHVEYKLAWLMLLTANCQNWPASLSPLAWSGPSRSRGRVQICATVRRERRDTLRQTNSLPQPLQIVLYRYGAVIDTSFHCGNCCTILWNGFKKTIIENEKTDRPRSKKSIPPHWSDNIEPHVLVAFPLAPDTSILGNHSTSAFISEVVSRTNQKKQGSLTYKDPRGWKNRRLLPPKLDFPER